MNKIFTLMTMLLMATLTINAQDFPLQFVDSNGNVVADGTVLELTEVEDLGYGDVQISSGLFVENTTTSDVVCGTEYSITALPSGAFQTCFPLNCVMKESTGSWTSETGTLAAGEKKSLQTEWLPASEGTAVAEFQLLKYKLNAVTKKYVVDTRGPKVTLKFLYYPTGITTTDVSSNIATVEYYTLDGRRISSPTHGMYVSRITYTNGVVKTTKQQF